MVKAAAEPESKVALKIGPAAGLPVLTVLTVPIDKRAAAAAYKALQASG